MLFLSTANKAFAIVFFNENTGMYVSTDENDSILAFGGTVYNEDGSIYGSKEGERRYLENLVPTDENIQDECSTVTSSVRDKSMKRNCVAYYTDEPTDRSVVSFEYTPENSFCIFELRLVNGITSKIANSIETDLIDVQLIDTDTGEIIARGYNLRLDHTYKSTVDASDISLTIVVASDNTRIPPLELKASSSDSKQAEESDITEKYEGVSIIRPMAVTGLVPKNIDGNQGKIMDTYKKTTSGNAYLKTTFSASSNSMATINIGYYWDSYGDVVSYITNLALGRYFCPTFSIGKNFQIGMKLSTNSNSGTATLVYAETALVT